MLQTIALLEQIGANASMRFAHGDERKALLEADAMGGSSVWPDAGGDPATKIYCLLFPVRDDEPATDGGSEDEVPATDDDDHDSEPPPEPRVA